MQGAGGAVLAATAVTNLIQPKKRVLRFAHLTDIHVQPERKAGEGMARAIEHAQEQSIDLIVTGGDQVMDCLGAGKERVQAQWDIWKRVMADSTSVPVEHCIGNHDIWGWTTESVSESEPMYGKTWAMDAMELSKPYRSFDRAGWHWIVLDSSDRNGRGYIARLDADQFEWLADDLAKTPKETPVIVVSHEPILAMCTFLDGDNEKSGQNWQVPGAWMHIDARKIKDLFRKHPNVKLAISGHIHLVDRVDYLGVTYLCNGAVSGGWWGGNYQEFGPGYAVIDLFDDGSFGHEFIEFGWKAAP